MSRRPHRSAAQWQRVIDRQARSGESAAAFCRQNDIGYASFMQWRSRLSNPDRLLTDADDAPEFIELTRDISELPVQHVGLESARIDADTSLMIELDLGGGIQLRITRGI